MVKLGGLISLIESSGCLIAGCHACLIEAEEMRTVTGARNQSSGMASGLLQKLLEFGDELLVAAGAEDCRSSLKILSTEHCENACQK